MRGKTMHAKLASALLAVALIGAGCGGISPETAPAEAEAAPTAATTEVPPPAEAPPATEAVARTTEPAVAATAATTTEAPATTAAAVPAAPKLEAGTYEVGVDIEPGIHRFYSSDSFYWERLSGFSGQFDDMLANGNNHQLVVEIKPTDVGFNVNDDVFINESYALITTSEELTRFADLGGRYVFEVGEGKDLAPGTYRVSGSCYYARLSGFSGEFSDLIANDNKDGRFIIEIKPEDSGFELACSATDAPTTESPATTTTTAAATTTGAAVPAAPKLEEGTYEVGVDIEPGIHRFYSSDSFYWERLSGFSGQFDDMLANGNNHQLVVEIKPTDVGFNVNDDVFINESYALITTSEELTRFADLGGRYVFEVGEGKDLAPGTYRVSGSCYYARLSGFSGEFSDLIANDNKDGRFIIEIKPEDSGFELAC